MNLVNCSLLLSISNGESLVISSTYVNSSILCSSKNLLTIVNTCFRLNRISHPNKSYSWQLSWFLEVLRRVSLIVLIIFNKVLKKTSLEALPNESKSYWSLRYLLIFSSLILGLLLSVMDS